ncbi:MAG: glycosyltransferase family 4 protein [Pirellulales bacterium]|nr:glycosyltransferase family 4 protein [Pirellulales bacterium]
MRVLYVESPIGFGGSLTGLLHLIRELPPEVEPILVTSFDPAPYIELPAGLRHRRVAVGGRHGSVGGPLAGAWRYFRDDVRPWRRAVDELIREFAPDVVHANNALSANWGAGQAARRRGVPSISHQKGFEYPGRLTRWLVRQSSFTRHIATSGAIAEHLVELGLPRERISTIYEPVIGPVEAPPTRSGNGRLVVGMHSILGPWKGQHIVIEAAADALRRGRTDFELVVAGTSPAGETDYLDELQRLAARLGVADRVRFAGHQRDVYQFLATIDVAVHASVGPEPFGRVAAEAMLCGVPTIVTTGGGPEEYVRHGETGLHVPCNDVAAMSAALERLAASPELRRRMGAAAREYAVAAFDPSRLTTQVVDLYHALVETPSERK